MRLNRRHLGELINTTANVDEGTGRTNAYDLLSIFAILLHRQQSVAVATKRANRLKSQEL